MDFWAIYGIGLAVILVLMTILWLISLRLKNSSKEYIEKTSAFIPWFPRKE